MSSTSSPRRLLHRRATEVQVYAREDGLFEVEATLVDTKTRDITLANGIRKAGEPVHDMLLELVIDSKLNIIEASSTTRAMPYVGTCGEHGNAYGRLVGLNLMQGFRLGVKERLAGVKGCTHLTELCQVLPTAVIQAFAGIVLDTREGDVANNVPPFQLDRCHALRRDGAVVLTHYPRWYRAAPEVPSVSEAKPAPSHS